MPRTITIPDTDDIKALSVDGVDHLVIIERGRGDGGATVSYLSLDPNGKLVNFRSWVDKPAIARASFDQVDAKAVTLARAIALKQAEAIAPSPAEFDAIQTDIVKREAPAKTG